MTAKVTVRKSTFYRQRWVFLLLFLSVFWIASAYFPSPTTLAGNHAYYSPFPPLITTSFFRVHVFLRGWHGQQVHSPYKFRFYSNKNMIVPPGGCASSDVMDVQIKPGRGWGSLIYVQAYPITVCE